MWGQEVSHCETLPPQRLGPDTWLEHQDPVSHMAQKKREKKKERKKERKKAKENKIIKIKNKNLYY